MRVALVTSAALLVTAALIACSGSPQSSGSGEDDSTSAPPKKPTDTSSTDTATSAPAATDPGDGGAADGAAAIATPGATDAGARCLPDSIQEAEPNDDPTTAMKIPAQTETICGRLEAGDVDQIQFVMPAQVRNFGYQPESGFVQIEATAGGQPFDPNGGWPFLPGQAYVFKLSSPGNRRAVDYRLRFTFDL